MKVLIQRRDDPVMEGSEIQPKSKYFRKRMLGGRFSPSATVPRQYAHQSVAPGLPHCGRVFHDTH
jgi:hypothetical protein